jgi:hypothetical protein
VYPDDPKPTHGHRSFGIRLASVLAVILALPSCHADPEVDPVSVRDSAGVRIVELPDTPGPEIERWTIDERSAVSIGVIEGPDEYVLPNVVGGTVLDDGTIVLDVFTPGLFELRYYDAGGTFITSAGHYGEGPFEVGELGPRGTLRLPGDSILVVGADSRYAVFGPRAEHGRQGRLPHLAGGFLAVGALDSGQIVYHGWIETMTRPDGWRRFRERGVIADLESDSAIEAVQMWGRIGWHDPDNRVYTNPFTPDAYVTGSAGVVWAAASEADEVRAYAPDGSLRTVVRLTKARTRVTRSVRKRYKEVVLRQVGEDRRRELRRHLARAEYPETMPLIQGLKSDREGNAWVRRYEPRYSEEDERWDVFSPSGTWLRTVVIPFDRLGLGSCQRAWREVTCDIVWEVDAHYILMHLLDAFNVQSVVRYDLVPAG